MGPIVATQDVVLRPFKTQNVKGTSRVVRHTKGVNVIDEPLREFLANMVVASTGELKLGLGMAGICLHNLTVGEVRIPTKSTLGHVQAANKVQTYSPLSILVSGKVATASQAPIRVVKGNSPSASCERRTYLRPL